MTYKLFIDDERFPVTGDWYVVRDSTSAMQIVMKKGNPHEISFDHDLGGDDTTMIFLKKWIEKMLDGELPKIDHSNFSYSVHSQNPIGSRNISMLLENFMEHK